MGQGDVACCRQHASDHWPLRPYCGARERHAGRYGLLYPELEGGILDIAVDIIRERKHPYIISDETARVVKEFIVPYWRGRSFHDGLSAALPADTRNLLFSRDNPMAQRNIVTETVTYRNSLQWVPDYEKVLKRGLKGIREEAQARLAALDPNDPVHAFEQRPFLEAVMTICDAVVMFAKRYAALASNMAAVEKDGERRSELLEIALICDWVPKNPARTFREAIQSQWMVSVFKRIEEKTGASYSNGRMDQYFYPYYKKDLEEGRLTEDGALELFENLWLNMAQFINLYVSPTFIAYNEGYTHWEAVTIGEARGRQGRHQRIVVSHVEVEERVPAELSGPRRENPFANAQHVPAGDLRNHQGRHRIPEAAE